MINILTNKLPASKDRDIIWKNDKPELYERFSQSICQKQETSKETSKETSYAPVPVLAPIKAPAPTPTHTPAPAPANIPKVLNVIPVPANRLPAILVNSPTPSVAIQDIPRVADAKPLPIVNKATKTGTQKKGNKDKNSPMKIIL